MSMLLNQAPRFSSASALRRHYSRVKERMAALAPPTVMALPSPEMMARGNVYAFPVPAPVVVVKGVDTGETATVEDIVPRQRLALPEKIKLLPPEAERVAVRCALAAIIAGIGENGGRKVRSSFVARAVAEAFKIDRRAIPDPTRKAGPTRIRQITAAMARMFTDDSLPQIGQALGGRDHTTVLHAVQKFEGRIRAALWEGKDF